MFIVKHRAGSVRDLFLQHRRDQRQRKGRDLHLRLLRRGHHPRYWVAIPPPDGGVLRGRRLVTWPYVLQALLIPHRLAHFPGPTLFVPVLYEHLAKKNLAEYDHEEAHPRLFQRTPEQPLASLAFVVVLPMLLVWLVQHAQAARALLLDLLPALAPVLPDTRAAWLEACGFDNVRMLLFGEWSRAVTALFLHADPGHLVANTAFSLFFVRFLAARTGFGAAVFLTLATGALANLATLPFRDGPFLSIGFSTALFATVGLLSGTACRHKGSGLQVMLPLACGAGLLALLGTGGEQTDYTAHVAGLVCGMAAGLGTGLVLDRVPGLLKASWQSLLLLLGLCIPVLGFWARLF